MGTAQCDMELLMTACRHSYNFHETDSHIYSAPHTSTEEPFKSAIERKDYRVVRSRGPDMPAFNGTNLGFSVMRPRDETDTQSPIIISFRGTHEFEDLGHDTRLGTTGVTNQEIRDSAYLLYMQTRVRYPNQPIVFTGHSLGGHLAQYVALRAMNENGEKRCLVRTFNSAPVSTRHEEVLKREPSLLQCFIHYRLENDAVTKLPSMGHHVGPMYTIPHQGGTVDAHRMQVMESLMPSEIRHLRVDPRERIDQLKERILGTMSSYDERIRNQWLSSLRIGGKKNELLQHTMKLAMQALKAEPPNLKAAIQEIDLLYHFCSNKMQDAGSGELHRVVKELHQEVHAVDRAIHGGAQAAARPVNEEDDNDDDDGDIDGAKLK